MGRTTQRMEAAFLDRQIVVAFIDGKWYAWNRNGTEPLICAEPSLDLMCIAITDYFRKKDLNAIKGT